jgi:hypothetical protein
MNKVEAAKNALTKAADDLNRLADYCENNYNEPEVISNNDDVKGKETIKELQRATLYPENQIFLVLTAQQGKRQQQLGPVKLP